MEYISFNTKYELLFFSFCATFLFLTYFQRTSCALRLTDRNTRTMQWHIQRIHNCRECRSIYDSVM